MNEKHDIASALKQFIVIIQWQFKKDIRIVRSDNISDLVTFRKEISDKKRQIKP